MRLSLKICSCSKADDLASGGHNSGDLWQELIGLMCVCLCAESVSCGLWWGRWRAARDRSVAATCVFVCFPSRALTPTPSAHTNTLLTVFRESEGEELCICVAATLQENAPRYLLPVSLCYWFNNSTLNHLCHYPECYFQLSSVLYLSSTLRNWDVFSCAHMSADLLEIRIRCGGIDDATPNV